MATRCRAYGLAAVFLFLVSCTYGPTTREAKITSVARRPYSTEFAVAVHVSVFRPPTGLSKFPGGGKRKTLEEYGLIYLCDAQPQTVRLLGRLERPENFIPGFEPSANGWREDTLYVKLSGQTGTSAKDLNQAVEYVWTKNQGFNKIDKRPDILLTLRVSAGNNPVANPTLILSKDSWTIAVSTDAMQAPQRAFTIDKQTGDLSVAQ